MIGQIILIIVGLIIVISCVGAIMLNYEKSVVKDAAKEKDLYEKCVQCDTVVPIRKDTPVDQRFYYVEGAGQLCEDCYDFVYRTKQL